MSQVLNIPESYKIRDKDIVYPRSVSIDIGYNFMFFCGYTGTVYIPLSWLPQYLKDRGFTKDNCNITVISTHSKIELDYQGASSYYQLTFNYGNLLTDCIFNGYMQVALGGNSWAYYNGGCWTVDGGNVILKATRK